MFFDMESRKDCEPKKVLPNYPGLKKTVVKAEAMEADCQNEEY